ncbi:MAG: bifunctional hydroxymethylpyrimidine kinase/phosphomethylpyrimidine kinase [Lentisphaeria bacterium]|nr:bifunctional hydroxymethylpyrimidine kinase/phosphomethylpyrimidine kinase [Lentisphaeria bacterium]NQZ67151.1 bifunctional hydroxymethylpyrimidine kinase/phosphomethylpyrimidine kinase [Lentisphaeria bacterium]
MTTPVCLTIAGSDSSGGAGIQADLRTFNYFKCYGTSVITALTAQIPRKLSAIEAVSETLVAQQLSAVSSLNISAAKCGMLLTKPIILCIVEAVKNADYPLIVDPVMIASSGKRLLEENAVDALVNDLLPQAKLITPNIPEAEIIVGKTLASLNEIEAAALAYSETGPAILIKGGHATDKDAVDVLAVKGELTHFVAERLEIAESHGTGCTLSAAITANLALGHSLPESIQIAKDFVYKSLQNIQQIGDETFALYPPEK